MLTQKQEDFCLNIVSGMSATDASLQAGYADPNHTSLMLKTVKISERITELRQPTVDCTKMLVAEREEKLSDIAREDIISAKGTPLRGPNISAIQELNKMGGDYAPVKTDHTFNGEGLSEILLKLRGYDAAK